MMRTRSRGCYFLIALLIATSIGCAFIDGKFFGRGQTLTFSHEQHVQYIELECESCHDQSSTGESAGMPEFRLCRECHLQSAEAGLAPEMRLDVYLVDGKPRWSSATRLSDEITFSHETHFSAGVTCESCHGEVRDSARVTDAVRVR